MEGLLWETWTKRMVMEVKSRVSTFHEPWKSWKLELFEFCKVGDVIYEWNFDRNICMELLRITFYWVDVTMGQTLKMKYVNVSKFPNSRFQVPKFRSFQVQKFQSFEISKIQSFKVSKVHKVRLMFFGRYWFHTTKNHFMFSGRYWSHLQDVQKCIKRLFRFLFGPCLLRHVQNNRFPKMRFRKHNIFQSNSGFRELFEISWRLQR